MEEKNAIIELRVSWMSDLFDADYLLCSKAVTRGVNKGAKEDFRAAMERESVAVMKALNHFSKYRGGDS